MIRTIKAKIIVCFGGAIIILFLLFGMTGYQVFSDYQMNMQKESQEKLAESLCSSILFFRQNVETVMEELLEGGELSALLPLLWEKGEDRQKLEAWGRAAVKENDWICDLFLMNQAGEIVGAGEEEEKVRTYLIDRISTAERYAGGIVWDSGYNTTSMMVFGKVRTSAEEKRSAYLFLQIDNAQILNLFNQFRLQNSQRFSLKGVRNGFEVTEQGFFYRYYDNYEDLLHTEREIGDWKLRTWSDKTLILGPAKELLYKLARVLIAALVVLAGISILLADRITRPIQVMKETMARYGKGDFSAKVRVTGRDEIGDLGRLLNQMSEQISMLFFRVKEEEEQSRRLELQAMVYQINPHFLYNTLDSVNILARQNGDEQVAELVTDLSRLFRLGLHQGQDKVTVRDELMHVMYYLKIQKIRFADQLRWEMHVPSSLMEYKIMKFILQPIVENAIYHGVKSREGIGCIQIFAQEEEEYLLLIVEDTGEGMSQETLQQLKERMNREANDFDKENTGQEKGFGLWNVHQRIRLGYGVPCGVELSSEEGKGTRVVLRVLRNMGD